ncbi:Oligopeptide transport ATP-binding protein OppD [Corynebacterium kutscheri]|uniref:ABC-type dipeptide/oligopeptide/nickel transport system, ATPase component n=1 Tax=Corynebacterium kutscheri TaxID=35755 RepID=A0A0F6R0X1_9CORY|nr:dipeptide/oligopeptide/nickel ABC transporter permease/ATP-binding protein [Corynebacterium kutscheri]AKE41962.1 ABC-type dipeptide/oligopeptide/nickel transport system, ATPase component [Corynebacterium kutscheri]VEH06270.1 Oligopeptide transport ATP-binding protein OppD [Corynebacterium kutscheri]VEH10303.1 Oligopeptide transport ATP-binding protein OppD [Corynebacterium kutscheri]VEH82184.1 Oligopeptide transport ATP-binding protein OppD [Corynebacterium kutscheri]
MRRKITEKLESRAGGRFGGIAQLPVASKIALGVLIIVVFAAVFAPLITSYPPQQSGVPVQPPSADHWFGTDAIGRDIFSRVVYGARSSLIIGLCATAAALAVAAVLGSIAATSGKVVSEVLMRILDIIMSFPGIALAAVFVAVFGNSLGVLVFAIGFLYVPQLSRIVRANVLGQFGEDYVSASKVMGASIPHILIKQVARNCIAPIAVFATVLVADAIVFEASLSFISAGVKPPEPSWGNILADGKQLLLSGIWWPTFFPGLMILITVLCLNILSEGLTDALAAPSQRGVSVEDKPERAEEDTVALGQTTSAEAALSLQESLTALRDHERETHGRQVFTGDPTPLLEVKNLSISFPEAHGDVRIVDDVSFSVAPGETLGLVGESGCGKSISAMSIMGLLPKTAKIEGEILYDGKNLLDLTPEQHNALRGHDIAMIYQDALSALNPSMLIRTQMKQLTRRGGKRSAEELLELVGLDPERTLKSYPHELSGGQRQRVLIAMALTRNPRLLIADEPTTALDVTVQAQVIDLLTELRDKLGFAMIFVSHDLALVARLVHKISVMYAGQMVEQGLTSEILEDPRHEYTCGLLGSVLSIEAGVDRLYQVPGTVPSPREFVAGDRFAPRSSRPTVGLHTKPKMQLIPGTTHSYAVAVEGEKP